MWRMASALCVEGGAAWLQAPLTTPSAFEGCMWYVYRVYEYCVSVPVHTGVHVPCIVYVGAQVSDACQVADPDDSAPALLPCSMQMRMHCLLSYVPAAILQVD